MHEERQKYMKKIVKLDELLEVISETQKFEPEDELTALIKETEGFADDELSFDELDMVSAAADAPNYDAFKKYMDDKKKR